MKACTKFLTTAVGVIAIGALLTPQTARAQGATGATFAGGAIANPAEGDTHSIATNSAFGLGADAGTAANFVDATAIGASSVAGAGAIALGHRAMGTGLRAIAIGTDAGGITPGGTGALANAQEAVALGPDAFAHAAGAEAIGLNANAGGLNSIAMGTASSSLGVNSIAMGHNASAPTDDDVALGAGATASAAGVSTAVGNGAQATGRESIAIGGAPTGTTNQTTAAGFGATAIGAGGLVDPGAQAIGDGSVAIGGVESVGGTPGAVASGLGAIAVGNRSISSGTNSVAVGALSHATATNASAFGEGATAGFAGSTAIGAGATTTAANQMMFGTAANTYQMPGIASAASLAAQTGPARFVTTDAAGHLAAGPSVASLFSNIGVLSDRIHDVRQEARGGIGLAIATGQIRYDDTPGKISVGVGGGAFEDEGGIAGGIGFTSPNGRFRGNISAGGTTNGDFGGGAGLSITLN